MGREVVAGLRPSAPAPHVELLLADVAELLSDRLPVVEVAVQGEAGELRAVAGLVTPAGDERSVRAGAGAVLPVDVIHGVAGPAHVGEFVCDVEPRLDLRNPGGLADADDAGSVIGVAGSDGTRTLHGRDLDLGVPRLPGREVVAHEDPGEAPPHV